MKTDLLKISILYSLVFSSFESKAQDTAKILHSTIYLVRTNSFVGSGATINIRFENQNSFALPVGGIVEYEMYSEGEILILGEIEYGETIRCKLNVKKGNVYYVYLTFGQFSEVPKEKVQKLLDKRKSFSKFKEDITSPISN